MSTAREQANASQRAASDPVASAFVTASAGSGKTKLLTDRLLRLILRGAAPERLLCLTFTKAAAAQMSGRLNARLGGWAVAEPDALNKELTALLGHAPGRAELACARAAFAQVLELPGGMRIATLHAFAQSLLRGFPLEAGLAPGFAVLEEMDAHARLAEAREAELPTSPATGHLAALCDTKGLHALLRQLRDDEAWVEDALRAAGGSLPLLRGRIADCLGLDPKADPETLAAEACQPSDESALARASGALRGSGNANDVQRGERIRAYLALGPAARLAAVAEWEAIFLTTTDCSVRKKFATKGAGAHEAFIQQTLTAEGNRLVSLRDRQSALCLLDATMAALTLGQPVLKQFEAAKRRIGRLDYDDLIVSARRLLDNPGTAWVLYKLDGGLDHVLLDEAQDSNPEQWGIARALTGEFYSGEGRTDPAALPRTLFAVGDVKQSIFGFQGADATGLPRAAGEFRQAAGAAGMEFRDVTLDVSFRSAPPILSLVDSVFAEGPAREGVVGADQVLRHNPDRAGAAGLVELWPLLAAGEPEEAPEWAVPEKPSAEAGPDARLAQALARRIHHMIHEEFLPARQEHDCAQPRKVRAGDILVLVRRRNAFLAQLVRALKELDVPVGGVDRMVLVEQLSVLDVLATLDAILLPADDLQLAAALKSPIFGLDDDALFELAHGRGGASLHARLMERRSEDSPVGEAAKLFAELTIRADHLPPHALIAEILSERGGRARLLARLGPDAADPLDELLTAALAHERAHPASLQHFLHWLRRAATEVKREPENTADRVRVMTVHGAKGLQAPIVILPDTTGAPPRAAGLRWTEDGLPLWAPRKKGFEAPPWTQAQSRKELTEAEESNRLLYVALTRAEDRLLVCGWYRKKRSDHCWYDKVEAGFRRLPGMAETPFEPGAWGAEVAGFLPGPMLYLHSAQTDPPLAEPARAAAVASTDLPAWARTPAPEAPGGRVATPSHMEDDEVEGAAATPHAPGDPLGARFRRGNLIHALLQSLPELEAAKRADAGARYLARPGHALRPDQQAEILEEALAVMANPGIAAAFAPGSLAEAPIAGRVGARLILGVVDRLLIRPEGVLILDFKTNRPPPQEPEAAPPAYLRQMAAYRAVLRLAFPGRPVDCALVWTYGARVMPLPAVLLDAHAPAA